jgi:hypothetical protein
MRRFVIFSRAGGFDFGRSGSAAPKRRFYSRLVYPKETCYLFSETLAFIEALNSVICSILMDPYPESMPDRYETVPDSKFFPTMQSETDTWLETTAVFLEPTVRYMWQGHQSSTAEQSDIPEPGLAREIS